MLPSDLMITTQVNRYDLTRHKNRATFTNLLAAVAHYNGTAKIHAADIFLPAVLPCENFNLDKHFLDLNLAGLISSFLQL